MTQTKEILRKLEQVERDEEVRILYACESGSRAWGFESADSDFDVRFIYVHACDWYLSVDAGTKRDVLELAIDGDLDINGWDVAKALRLFQRSNPPLLEAQLRQLRTAYYSAKSCAHHYLHMARGNFRDSFRGAQSIVRSTSTSFDRFLR